MKITKNIYYIATNTRPIEFLMDNGDTTTTIENAQFLFTQQEAEIEMNSLDEPEQFDIIEGQIIVNL